MKKFISAISFLTIIPVPKSLKDLNGYLNNSTVYFPLVGLIIGLFLCLIYFLSSKIFPTFISSLFVVFAEVLTTRSLHLDGFSDFFDGMFGGQTKEDKIRIMKDHNVGVFGAVSLIFLILLKINFLFLIKVPYVYSIILIMPIISRWIILYPILKMPYAKETGLGKIFELKVLEYITATFMVFVILYLMLSFVGVFSLLCTFILILFIIRNINKQIGGMTGDVYGFLIELSELIFVFLLSILIIK